MASKPHDEVVIPMPKQPIRADLPLLKELRRINAEMGRLFPRQRMDPSLRVLFQESAEGRRALKLIETSGLYQLGLILDEEIDQSRADWCTPINCRTFARSGGESHFSLLIQDGTITENAPVVLTDFDNGGKSLVVGETLFDFLCFGSRRGYSRLEQLAYFPKQALEAYTNPRWKAPAEDDPLAKIFRISSHERRLLAFLKASLGLKPWTDPRRFHQLQAKYSRLLELPADMEQ
jgi:hypothetical protein